MILTPAESQSFFRLWACIDAYVCSKTNVLSGSRTPEQMTEVGPADLASVRSVLRDRPELLDDFVRLNPYDLSPEELDDVRGFRHSVGGTFFVERCLKKHAIFVGTDSDNPGVFAVGGLTERIDVVLTRGTGAGSSTMIAATLLPFRGRIVWDGIISTYNVSFGGGMRAEFRNAYLRAKERGELIVSLPPGTDGPAASPAKPRRSGRDWKPAVDAIVLATEKLGKPRTAMQRAAFRLLKHAAVLARATLEEPEDIDVLFARLRDATRSYRQVSEAIERECWY